RVCDPRSSPTTVGLTRVDCNSYLRHPRLGTRAIAAYRPAPHGSQRMNVGRCLATPAPSYAKSVSGVWVSAVLVDGQAPRMSGAGDDRFASNYRSDPSSVLPLFA